MRFIKHTGNPVLGGELGTCFDICVLREENGYRMYFSWRPQKSVAVVSSADGVNWEDKPTICIAPRVTPEGWEDDLNRPSVIKRDGKYHMWYTGQYKAGQADGSSHLFYAVSEDGITFNRVSDRPVLAPELPWEKVAVMNPDVLWDERRRMYRMWYAAGEQYEPNALGYAESPDGLVWQKHISNPVFTANRCNAWERHKIGGCHVAVAGDWHYMFYIGYRDEHYAQIGVARSKNGLDGWQRLPSNPILAPTEGEWDGDACYKPFTIYDGSRWMLWYNGRKGHVEQIGVAFHQGLDPDFDA